MCRCANVEPVVNILLAHGFIQHVGDNTNMGTKDCSSGPFVHNVGFTTKGAVIFPDLEEAQKCFYKPAPVLFALKIIAARRAIMDGF